MPGTPLPTPTLRGLASLGLAAFLAAALAEAAGLWDAPGAARTLPDLCAFHRVTGRDCPGCGMGRSLAALAAGQPQAALAAHPFGPLLLGGVAVAVARPALAGVFRRAAPLGAVAVLGWWLVARVLRLA